MVLTTLTTGLFATVLWVSLSSSDSFPSFLKQSVVPFAMSGALLYAFPLYVSGYASLSLNPPTLFKLIGRLWLSLVIGVIVSIFFRDEIQPAAAFLGGILPLAALDFVQKKTFGGGAENQQAPRADLLEITQYDEELIGQLNFIGVRSILQLAYENPLRIFIDTDLTLHVCLDLVDQANFYEVVPDKQCRENLRKRGIRSALDLMTQVFLELDTPGGVKEWRYLEDREQLPDYLVEPLTQIARAMKLHGIAELRNLLQMMIDNPQLTYLHELWRVISWSNVERRPLA